MHKKTPPHFKSRHSLALFAALTCSIAQAQQIAPSPLPDSPDLVASLRTAPSAEISSSSIGSSPQTTPATATPPAHQDGQTKRILGIIPNFRAVSADTVLPPQTIKDKLVDASEDSFDYSSIFLPATLAGVSLSSNSIPEFQQGAVGYGRYFWRAFTDQTIENYMVEFVIPVVHHEDTRYYTLGHGGFIKRSGYALGHVLVTKSDSGHATFNAGEVIGAGAAAGISGLYYPSSQRTFNQTGQRWVTNVGIDAATFVFKEFWPDINHTLFHGATPYSAPSNP